MEFENIIVHTGVAHDEDPPGRGSGRYAWGSGENPYQPHGRTSLSIEVNRLKKLGKSEAEIAIELLGYKGVSKKTGEPIPYTSTDLRREITIEKNRVQSANIQKAVELYDKYGNKSEVARQMGINESQVRRLLDPYIQERTARYENVANYLKDRIGDDKILDVSTSDELYLGVTADTFKTAIRMLEKEGYVVSYVKIPQNIPGQFTSIKVITKPLEGETLKDTNRRIQANKYNLTYIEDFTPDAGKIFWTPEFPASLDSSRIFIRYGDKGGSDKDGVIEIRKGVPDLSLNGSLYSQVRIMVDNKYYMKGMAIYADDVPEGKDIIFNTNKPSGTPMGDVLKTLKGIKETGKVDKDNPFGATIMRGGQYYIDGKLSPINKINDEGSWDSWSRNLSSQFLSKQPQKIIDQQLSLSIAYKEKELQDILNLTNPVIKQKMLKQFADDCDANASDLSAVGFKNQAFQVILPVTQMSDKQIYAPKFKDGDVVALVRYPHAGTFEIPVLTVNNKNKHAKTIMENASDAVGINPKVAKQLSGADFDGDTVLVIPMRSNKLAIKYQKYLKELEDFDLNMYATNHTTITNGEKQRQMGVVSNLISDMTLQGAPEHEIARAVKHSMVVIDSEKHKLDWKQSAIDNDIASLIRKYQANPETGKKGGASTIVSRAKSEAHPLKRKEITDRNKMTPEELKAFNAGKKILRETGDTRWTKVDKGKPSERWEEVLVREKVPQMDVVDNAFELVRDPNDPKERAYANYANSLKSIANRARAEMRAITPTKVNTTARDQIYSEEVASLRSKLITARRNAPRERAANTLANQELDRRVRSNPALKEDREHYRREHQRCLTWARAILGAGKEPINITDREWEAIQANAISTNVLRQILDNTDQEAFKIRATPRRSPGVSGLSQADINLIRSMINSGMYTQAEIAERIGVSTSTISAVSRNER